MRIRVAKPLHLLLRLIQQRRDRPRVLDIPVLLKEDSNLDRPVAPEVPTDVPVSNGLEWVVRGGREGGRTSPGCLLGLGGRGARGVECGLVGLEGGGREGEGGPGRSACVLGTGGGERVSGGAARRVSAGDVRRGRRRRQALCSSWWTSRSERGRRESSPRPPSRRDVDFFLRGKFPLSTLEFATEFKRIAYGICSRNKLYQEGGEKAIKEGARGRTV